ncbi:MAG: LarC family nickel insertion protein [Desulfosporosinus sp.]
MLYWDTFAGISGDMALGSLIALGADPKIIVDQLHSIGLTEFVLDVRSRQIHGIQATDINVVIQNKDHQHHQRRLQDIQKMILSGNLSERSQKRALLVFNVLAEAEAHVHGTTLDQIHFHEVGAVDSLVDIVGTCIALDQLDIDLIRVSTLPWSHGFVHCTHGILPLPAPATLMLLRGFKFHESGITGELITPTGAAFIRAFAQQATFPEMTLLNVGYGAGKNDYGIPSLLRGILGET